jgi:hypothetical protein
VVWVDGEVLSGLGVDEPRELHDRAPRRVEDDALDVLGSYCDLITDPSNDGYLRCGGHAGSVPSRECYGQSAGAVVAREVLLSPTQRISLRTT